MIMADNKLDLCARAYLEYYRSEFKKYAWAYDYADELIKQDPHESLEFVMELLSLCHNEQEVAYIAAGLLEDLLHRHLNSIRDDIETYCRQDKLMRVAVRYVWSQEKSLVSNFLNQLHDKFGILSEQTIVNLKAIDE